MGQLRRQRPPGGSGVGGGRRLRAFARRVGTGRTSGRAGQSMPVMRLAGRSRLAETRGPAGRAEVPPPRPAPSREAVGIIFAPAEAPSGKRRGGPGSACLGAQWLTTRSTITPQAPRSSRFEPQRRCGDKPRRACVSKAELRARRRDVSPLACWARACYWREFNLFLSTCSKSPTRVEWAPPAISKTGKQTCL